MLTIFTIVLNFLYMRKKIIGLLFLLFSFFCFFQNQRLFQKKDALFHLKGLVESWIPLTFSVSQTWEILYQLGDWYLRVITRWEQTYLLQIKKWGENRQILQEFETDVVDRVPFLLRIKDKKLNFLFWKKSGGGSMEYMISSFILDQSLVFQEENCWYIYPVELSYSSPICNLDFSGKQFDEALLENCKALSILREKESHYLHLQYLKFNKKFCE